jgi:hypothetical protein
MPMKSSNTAFVIMPFAPEFRPGYEEVIEPAVRAAGLECIRADQETLGHIHRMMFERIFESPVVVADISGGNPNVFYELGVSHAAACRTVTVVRQDYAKGIPFDIAPYRVIIYPKRPEEPADERAAGAYREALAEAVSALAASIIAIQDKESGGVPNPVQDYLATRSPLTCGESRYVDSLTDSDEEEMLRTANSLTAVGITGLHFATLLARVVEAGERTKPLSVRLLCLDPDDRDGWRYVYHLREGRVVSDDEFEDLLAEDRMTYTRVSRVVERLNRRSDFRGEIVSYSGIPVIWAYLVDDERLIVGNFAMNRLSSRLPVSVLVRDDPRTRTMYRYYTAVVEGLARLRITKNE